MVKFNQRGAENHRSRMPQAAGETVTLTRGEQTITITDAMRSPSMVNALNADGFPVRLLMIVWWLPIDQVIFDGTTENEPRMGDVITDANGVEFQPMRPTPDTPAVGSTAGFWLVSTKQWSVVSE